LRFAQVSAPQLELWLGLALVTVQNRTHVYMNIFHHKDLGNHLLQLCLKVVKHPVYYMATACLRRGIDPTASNSSSGLSDSLETWARATHLTQEVHVAW